MRRLNKFAWYGAAASLPLVAQTSLVGGHLAPKAGPVFYLHLSLLMTMIQVGQATAFQVLLSRHDASHIPSRVGGFAIGMLCALLAGVFLMSSAYLQTVALALSGLFIGITFSVGSAHLLKEGSEIRYFQRLLLRNVFVLTLAYLLGGLLGGLGTISFVLGMCVLGVIAVAQVSQAKGAVSGSSVALGRPECVAILLGTLASALYRNDQNLVRLFAGARGDFYQFHNALLLGSGFQAIVGALMTTVGLPFIRSRSFDSKKLMAIDSSQAAISGLLVIVAIAFVVTGREIVAALIACIILALNQWWSFRLHSIGRSQFVYIFGGLSFLLLLGLLAVTRAPGLSFLIYAAVLTAVLGLITWRVGNAAHN